MYVVNKLRPSREGKRRYCYGDYKWDRRIGPKPGVQPAAAPNPTKLPQRQTMRSVNRNR